MERYLNGARTMYAMSTYTLLSLCCRCAIAVLSLRCRCSVALLLLGWCEFIVICCCCCSRWQLFASCAGLNVVGLATSLCTRYVRVGPRFLLFEKPDDVRRVIHIFCCYRCQTQVSLLCCCALCCCFAKSSSFFVFIL